MTRIGCEFDYGIEIDFVSNRNCFFEIPVQSIPPLETIEGPFLLSSFLHYFGCFNKLRINLIGRRKFDPSSNNNLARYNYSIKIVVYVISVC